MNFDISLIRNNLKKSIPLANFSKFKTGGKADYMFFPKDVSELILGLKVFNENKIDFYVIGEGTNLLIHDNGFRGVIIKLKGKNFAFIKNENSKIHCGAGMKNGVLAKFALTNELSGLEFLYSFPGSIGGSVFGNAGNIYGEISEKIDSISGVNTLGEKITYLKKDLTFKYRETIFPEKIIITEVVFNCIKSSYDKIEKLMKTIITERRISNPRGKTSGSVFKNPEGIKAWQVIEKIGLRDAKVGDARISEKHLNWIINSGKAKSSDIFSLIKLIQEESLKKMGVKMELELKLLGDFIKK